jgi:hypothetical protein
MYLEVSDGIIVVVCISVVAVALIKQLFNRR